MNSGDPPDNVIPFVKHLNQRRVDSGEYGIFASPNHLETDLLHKLIASPGDNCNPHAVGLLTPVGRPADLDAVYVGWQLSPNDARALARLLERYADECEKGFP